MSLPAVAPVLDADRYVSYSPVTPTTDFNITFPIFGDDTDVLVLQNGVPLFSGYQVLSPSGTLSLLPRPVTDAYVRLTTAQSSGTLAIAGAIHPRRTVQATSALTTRDFNLSFSGIVASLREMWSGLRRAIKAPYGETTDLIMPIATARANKILGFDNAGLPIAVSITLPVYTPEGSGAIGNGIANDTAAIQSFLDSIEAAGGGIAWMTKDYAVSNITVGEGVIIDLDGPSGGSIRGVYNTSGPVISSKTGLARMACRVVTGLTLTVASPADVVLRDVSFLVVGHTVLFQKANYSWIYATINSINTGTKTINVTPVQASSGTSLALVAGDQCWDITDSGPSFCGVRNGYVEGSRDRVAGIANVCQAQTRTGAGNLVMNGSLVWADGSARTSFMHNCRPIIHSTGANTGINVTLFGFATDKNGAEVVVSETLAGPAANDYVMMETEFSRVPPNKSATNTITIASPAVVTWTGHGLVAGLPWAPTTTGALPTGLVAGTTYFVRNVLSADTFTVSATAGGSEINTSGTQSGVHTGTSNSVVSSGTITGTLSVGFPTMGEGDGVLLYGPAPVARDLVIQFCRGWGVWQDWCYTPVGFNDELKTQIGDLANIQVYCCNGGGIHLHNLVDGYLEKPYAAQVENVGLELGRFCPGVKVNGGHIAAAYENSTRFQKPYNGVKIEADNAQIIGLAVEGASSGNVWALGNNLQWLLGRVFDPKSAPDLGGSVKIANKVDTSPYIAEGFRFGHVALGWAVTKVRIDCRVENCSGAVLNMVSEGGSSRIRIDAIDQYAQTTAPCLLGATTIPVATAGLKIRNGQTIYVQVDSGTYDARVIQSFTGSQIVVTLGLSAAAASGNLVVCGKTIAGSIYTSTPRPYQSKIAIDGVGLDQPEYRYNTADPINEIRNNAGVRVGYSDFFDGASVRQAAEGASTSWRVDINGNVRLLGYADGVFQVNAGFATSAERATAAATLTINDTDNVVIFGAACTVTLPAANTRHIGRELTFQAQTAAAVISASSNVIPATGGAAGTAIVPASAGASRTIKCIDGTNWRVIR